MIVTLDGERLSGQWGAPASLEALVEQVRREHLGERVVVEIALNGHSLVTDSLERQLPAKLADADQVDLASAAPRALAVEALRETATRLSDAAQAHHRAAETLQGGRVVDAVNDFGALLNVWQDCQRTITDAAVLLREDVTTRLIDQRTIRDQFNDLAHKLREVRDAFESRDFVLLADLLEFEMPGLCRRWSELLDTLATEFERE